MPSALPGAERHPARAIGRRREAPPAGRGAKGRASRLIGAPESGIGTRSIVRRGSCPQLLVLGDPMKVRNSLKSLRARHRDNRLVRRKGRVYIINKTQKRFKARQG